MWRSSAIKGYLVYPSLLVSLALHYKYLLAHLSPNCTARYSRGAHAGCTFSWAQLGSCPEWTPQCWSHQSASWGVWASLAGAFRLGVSGLVTMLSAQVAKSIGEPEAKLGDTHTDSSFIAKPWSTMPCTITCKMTPSASLRATLMQPSLKTCINLKTVSFLK